jgi:hypothetical protein
MIPTGYCHAQYRYTGAALPYGAAMTMGYNVTAFSGDVQDLAEVIGDSWGARFAAVTQIDVLLRELFVKKGPDATGPSSVHTVNINGTQNDPAANPATAALVSKVTASGGRRNRGRLYMPGLWDGAVGTAGTLSSGLVTSISTAWNNHLLDLDTAGIFPVILHSDEGSPTSILSMSVQSKVATQRRRLRR